MNDLDKLKSLLFGAEKQALESITERVQKPETRVVDVADVLPEAVRMSNRQGPDLAEALRDPVGECIKESFKKEPREYADALYPVMGPAIRKSIINALRTFAQQINDTVEQSVSAKGIKWRLEAWRAGIPFGEYVVQRTLQYRVEQAYLISRDNGLLIAHAHHEASRIKDSDAVSAMFTAIQDFIKESFSPDRSGRLETADMGEFTLWAVHGPHALLVCVIRGVPPRALRADLSAVLERIHFRYGDAVRDYSGDTTAMLGIDEDLAECLRFEAMKAGDAKNRRSSFVVVLLVAAAAALGWFIYQGWLHSQQQAELFEVLSRAPGIYITDIERNGSEFHVRGLRDPLAEPLETLVDQAGLSAERVSADLRPFRSLDSDIVLRRAEILLGAPETVSVERVGERLVLGGSAAEAWLSSARQLAAAGSLGLDVDLHNVQSVEVARLRTEAAAFGNAEFHFTDGSTMAESEFGRLETHAAALSRLAAAARRMGLDYRVRVTGHTDSQGSIELNGTIAESRTEFAVAELQKHGIEAAYIERSRDIGSGTNVDPGPGLRRVSIDFELTETPAAEPPRPE